LGEKLRLFACFRACSLIKPERIAQIKTDHIKRTQAAQQKQTSPFLTDILDDEEEIGCAACFI
jgi:hypothetical protein